MLGKTSKIRGTVGLIGAWSIVTLYNRENLQVKHAIIMSLAECQPPSELGVTVLCDFNSLHSHLGNDSHASPSL